MNAHQHWFYRAWSGLLLGLMAFFIVNIALMVAAVGFNSVARGADNAIAMGPLASFVSHQKGTGDPPARLPRRIFRSVGPTPDTMALIRISPFDGSGMATSAHSRTLGGPYFVRTQALGIFRLLPATAGHGLQQVT